MCRSNFFELETELCAAVVCRDSFGARFLVCSFACAIGSTNEFKGGVIERMREIFI
jgi:hypothetical protein